MGTTSATVTSFIVSHLYRYFSRMRVTWLFVIVNVNFIFEGTTHFTQYITIITIVNVSSYSKFGTTSYMLIEFSQCLKHATMH